jgi:hypothetical protein
MSQKLLESTAWELHPPNCVQAKFSSGAESFAMIYDRAIVLVASVMDVEAFQVNLAMQKQQLATFVIQKDCLRAPEYTSLDLATLSSDSVDLEARKVA